MPSSNEIHQLIHSGSIEAQITLISTDSNQMEIPRNFYLPLNRNSYLPLYYTEILRYFKEYLLVPGWADRSSWWLRDLDNDKVPLRWDKPIGVIYDTVTGLDPILRSQKSQSQENRLWHLELCYRNYPENEILPLPDWSTLHSLWMNLMKESCFIMNGSSKAMMKLSKDDTDQLWEEGVVRNDLSKFTESFNKVKPETMSMIKRVPLRTHIAALNKTINVPVNPYTNTTEKTLLTVMNELLPDLFPADSQQTKPLAKVIIHGIEVPALNKDLTLLRLFNEGFYSIDGFIHISVVLETTKV